MSAIRGWGVKGPDGDLIPWKPMGEQGALGLAGIYNGSSGISDDAAERYRAVRVVLREEE